MIPTSCPEGFDLLSHGKVAYCASTGFATFCRQYLFYSALEMSPFAHVDMGFFASL